jgi:uncharacterized damage-inducible protein DinB
LGRGQYNGDERFSFFSHEEGKLQTCRTKEVLMLSETEQYLHMIDDLRRQVVELVRDLPAEGLNWRPIEGMDDHATNSLAVLAAHVAGSEHFWMAEVVGQRPVTRVRAAEFQTEAADSVGLVAKLEASGAETKEILEGLTAADLEEKRPAPDGRMVPVRWAILHVVDHMALHLGHMQLTYQLWQGGQGKGDPRWFERLPK